jgi:transposase InsO family protein
LYGCFDRRADALFELTDAVLTGPDRVWSLVELSQEKAFRRGHGALYDGLGHLHHARYETFEEARADIANYIELFYNQERLHSGLAYQTPHEVHYGFLKPQVAG